MYKIIFSDGEVWNGGEPENSMWNEMPSKPIKKIEYTLLGHTFIFEGYDSYNHLKEKVQFIHNNNEQRITKIFLMARKNDIVYICIFDLWEKKIDTVTADFGKEYHDKPTTGWKEGLIDSIPTYNFL